MRLGCLPDGGAGKVVGGGLIRPLSPGDRDPLSEQEGR